MGLSDKAEERLQRVMGQYPDKRSALMSALFIAQEELGFVSEEAIDWVSERTSVPAVHVLEVATFFTLFYKAAKGRYHIQVCRSVSCSLRGARALVELLKKRFNLSPNQVSSNAMWSYEEVDCLGACGSAPACRINDHYFENLSEERLLEIIAYIEAAQPDLRFSEINNSLPAIGDKRL